MITVPCDASRLCNRRIDRSDIANLFGWLDISTRTNRCVDPRGRRWRRWCHERRAALDNAHLMQSGRCGNSELDFELRFLGNRVRCLDGRRVLVDGRLRCVGAVYRRRRWKRCKCHGYKDDRIVWDWQPPVAISGTMKTMSTATVCSASEIGTVYHLRLPTLTDGSVTSPKRSRGIEASFASAR